jgi:hypothetical protein
LSSAGKSDFAVGKKEIRTAIEKLSKVWWPYATLFVFLFFYFSVVTIHIHSYNHSFITFAEALLHIFIAAGSVGGTSLPWGSEPRFELGPCRSASQRTTI